jgi:threonylcarbamoyladenosine tRNA methylthiotransferase MtaB
VRPHSLQDVEVVSFGCRLNLVEGEAVRRAARAAGRNNLVIVNSCGVTSEAARQARQAIRRLKREQPDRAVIVTGCASEMEPARFAAMPEVDAIVGNLEKAQEASWWSEPGETVPMSPLAEGVEDHTRAFLAVQNGCDHACTFCAIPAGRGRSRSAPMADIVASARRLVRRGFREVVLTGVDLTSWGCDLMDAPTLGLLVRRLLADVPDLERLRLSSIDCIEADPDLLTAFAEEERLMPYLHLSLQSGDDMILKRMKRRHTRADSVAFCAEVRRRRPDMAFGADLIAGFPTESDEMAANSEALIGDCGLTFLHVFPFSPRPGTPAARMPPLASGLAKERAARLREKGERALRRHLRDQIGRHLPVLVERGGVGRAPDFTPVAVGAIEPGTIQTLRIVGQDGRKLYGRPLDDL